MRPSRRASRRGWSIRTSAGFALRTSLSMCSARPTRPFCENCAAARRKRGRGSASLRAAVKAFFFFKLSKSQTAPARRRCAGAVFVFCLASAFSGQAHRLFLRGPLSQLCQCVCPADAKAALAHGAVQAAHFAPAQAAPLRVGLCCTIHRKTVREGPVSYTHLDVYKRQVSLNSTSTFWKASCVSPSLCASPYASFR